MRKFLVFPGFALIIATCILFALFGGCGNPNPSTSPSFGRQFWQPISHFEEKSPRGEVTVVRTVTRMKVPNGWIYLSSSEVYGTVRDTMVFVPNLFPEGCITADEVKKEKTTLPNDR